MDWKKKKKDKKVKNGKWVNHRDIILDIENDKYRYYKYIGTYSPSMFPVSSISFDI